MNYGRGTARFKWGTNGTSSGSGGTNFYGSYTEDFYVSRYFSNGLCLGSSKTNYFSVYNASSGGIKMELNNGTNALTLDSLYGFQLKAHGDFYAHNPFPICYAGLFTGGSTYAYLRSSYANNGVTHNSITRNDTGKYTLKLNLHPQMTSTDYFVCLVTSQRSTVSQEVDGAPQIVSKSISNGVLTLTIEFRRIHAQSSWSTNDFPGYFDPGHFNVLVLYTNTIYDY